MHFILSIILEAVHVYPYVVFCALYLLHEYICPHTFYRMLHYFISVICCTFKYSILYALYAKKTKIKIMTVIMYAIFFIINCKKSFFAGKLKHSRFVHSLSSTE